MMNIIIDSESRWRRLLRSSLWILLCFLVLVLLLGLFRFFIHRELFLADLSTARQFVSSTTGGFWNWLVYDIPVHIATLTVGFFALFVGLLSWNQKKKADRKAEWWRRTQYAIDLALSNDKNKTLAGFSILEHLGTEESKRTLLSPGRKTIADADDLRLFKRIIHELRRGHAPGGRINEPAIKDQENAGNA